MKLKRIILLVLLCASLLALPAFVGGITGNGAHAPAAQTAYVVFSGCSTDAPTTGIVTTTGSSILLPACDIPTTNLVGWNS